MTPSHVRQVIRFRFHWISFPYGRIAGAMMGETRVYLTVRSPRTCENNGNEESKRDRGRVKRWWCPAAIIGSRRTPGNSRGIFKKPGGRSVKRSFTRYDSAEDDIDGVGHQRRSCARAYRQQCTPPVLFEHITMNHVGETRLMISGWDVPRTQPVVPPRRLHAPPSRPPFRTPLDTVVSPPWANRGTLSR